jgi:hypothetical protein
MRAFTFKLILLTALFVAIVVKGGQFCATDGVQAMTRLVEPGPAVQADPPPVRPIEEEFRGVSPLPGLAERAIPSSKVVKSSSATTRKSVKSSMAAKSAAARKPARQS